MLNHQRRALTYYGNHFDVHRLLIAPPSPSQPIFPDQRTNVNATSAELSTSKGLVIALA